MRRVLKLALATAAIGITTSPAFAQTANVNGVSLASGQNTTVHFGGPAGTTASSDLYLALTGASGGNYTFSYTFTNTNVLVSNLTGFGFTADPTLLSITGVTGGLGFVLNPINFPGGYDVDACFYSGNNCDAANGQGDLFSGSFTLGFGSGVNAITLDGFVARYASLTQLNNQSGEGTPVRGVPEPATWAMMLLGFGGIGMTMRRRRKEVLAQIA